MNTKNEERLQAMLTYCRPHGGAGEKQFVERFIRPYEPEEIIDAKGEVMAYVVQVGALKDAPVLWCAHVDTVHKQDAPVKQTIVYDEGCGMIYKDDKIMPLGADDGAGVWMLLEMIDAKVPGTYLFHRGEERGGIGSGAIAAEHSGFVRQFKWAIAFDRRGTGDVITEQFTGETASVAFAQAFADALAMEYKPCPNGVFTDTANYASIIPECTNISVGYDSEHTPNETLDVWHLVQLRDAVIAAFGKGIDLPVVRDPAASLGKWSSRLTDFEATRYEMGGQPVSAEDICNMRFKDLVRYVRDAHPEDVADLLLALAEEVNYKQYEDATVEDAPLTNWKYY
jgi:hypothetical protein